MDENIIVDVLKRWNFWEKEFDSGVERTGYVEKIYSYFKRREVIVLKGIRRSGKSTILKQLMMKLIKNKINKEQILYLNLEDYNFTENLNIDLLEQVLNAYWHYLKNKGKVYYFIDEIQKIDGWEKWIRTKYDLNENIKFVVTGSSASLLSKELSTLLTGRNLSFEVFPLSFKEFLEFNKKGVLEEYLKFGGFPEVVLEKSPEKKLFILQQYFEDIVYKDIIQRHGIRNTKQLMGIARYIISTSSSKVSFNKLSKVFGLSKDTISLYVSYMVDAYLLFEVTYFSFSAKIKHDITKLSKFYALDNGLINVASIKYSKNLGQMYENTVFIKLLESCREISYWSELKSEVDFIAENTAINVTATDEIPEREQKGFDDFKKTHKGFSFILITKSTNKENMISLESFLKKNRN
ncbi:MAG: ATP-binding protein [Candidatus Diapherotrites archaeon]|nr:ATP-binding protein [Candidatus Diapherotrites archaeon]